VNKEGQASYFLQSKRISLTAD